MDENFQKLYSDLKGAARVVFLGFGFHPDNMKRINLKEHVDLKNAQIYATTYSLTENEIISSFQNDLGEFDDNINVNGISFSNAVLNTKSILDCNNFLREKIDFNSLFKK